MQLALNQNSCDMELFQFFESAKNFKGVELNFESLSATINSGSSIRTIKDIITSYNFSVVSLFELWHFSLSPDKIFKMEILPKFSSMLEIADKLEVDLITLTPSLYDGLIPDTDAKPRIVRRTQKRLIELSKIAFKEDVRLGFEFSSFKSSSIKNLEETKQVLKPLENRENIGYICDTFHFENSHSDFNLLNEVKDYIFLVQLADCKASDGSIEEFSDENRVLPGEGDSDLKFNSIIELFTKFHYRGMYSLELYKASCQDNLYEKLLSNIFKEIR